MLQKAPALAWLPLVAAAMFWALPVSAQSAPEDREYQVLGKILWVIMTRRAPDAEPDKEAMQAHMEHQFRLEKEGVMFGAGPLWDADGNIEGGMIIIRADSQEEAVRIADSDPMHARGLRTYTLHKWMLNEGHLNIRLDYSRGTFSLE